MYVITRSTGQIFTRREERGGILKKTKTYPGHPSKVATTKRVSMPCRMLS